MNNKFFGLSIAAVMLFAISCSQIDEAAGVYADGEEVTVTFSVATEERLATSRATDGEATPRISDGTKVDMLVYAVYSPNSDGSYRLLDQYGEGVDPLFGEESGITAGEGQTVLQTHDLLKPEGHTITLRLMRGKTYRFAFWAQSSLCKAYNTKNLEAVTVDYKALNTSALEDVTGNEDGDEGDEGEGGGESEGDGDNGNVVVKLAPNNDELRDAFCQVKEFTAEAGLKINVVLTRALAQVNVGTAGWDYNAEVSGGWGPYVYSKIKLTGVCTTIDVVADKVDKDKTTDVEYDWALIPAYLGAEEEIDAQSKEGAEAFKNYLIDSKNDKEFLWVKLTDVLPTDETAEYFDKGYLKYLTTLPSEIEEKNKKFLDDCGTLTEVFKYLSMCYVLAPEFKTTLDEVTFSLAEKADGTMSEDPVSKDPVQVFTITNVPVQRNWRTNILGGTNGENSIFDPHAVSLWVDIRPGFDGEHNKNGNEDWTTQNDWPGKSDSNAETETESNNQ